MSASEPYPVSTYHDDKGRSFGYVHIRHPGSSGLGIHFSAFFGAWGDAKPYRDNFRGYFHRLKMLGSNPAHDWLFLCDTYGAFENGTYYTGEPGDLFVERAMEAIIRHTLDEGDYARSQAVTVGSSMGGTAAIKFALTLDLAGIVAICPHIDLDTSALHQDRIAEVAFICPDGDALGEQNWHLTRQIRDLVTARSPERVLPALFIQSARDDVGVHAEQVLPLISEWRAHGGTAFLDERERGGHTSDYATGPLLHDAVDHLLEGKAIDITVYQADPAFAGAVTTPPLSHRLRRRASLFRKRVRGLFS